MEKGGLSGSIRSDQGQCFTRPDREMVYVEQRSCIDTDDDIVEAKYRSGHDLVGSVLRCRRVKATVTR